MSNTTTPGRAVALAMTMTMTMTMMAGRALAQADRPDLDRASAAAGVRAAPVILIGTALEVVPAGGATVACAQLHVEAVVRGEDLAPGMQIEVAQDMLLDHAPRLASGDRALVFLVPMADGGRHVFAATQPALVPLPLDADALAIAAQLTEVVAVEPAPRLGEGGPERLWALCRLVAEAEAPVAAIALADLSTESRLAERLQQEEKDALLERWLILELRDPMARSLALVLVAARDTRVAGRLCDAIVAPTGSELETVGPGLLVRLGLERSAAAELVGRLALPETDRRSVYRALGILGDTGSVPLLIRTLRDPEREVRREVILALGHLGDERALPHLLQLAMGSDPADARPAVAALTMLDHPRAWEALRAMRTEHPVPELRAYAGQACTDPFGLRY